MPTPEGTLLQQQAGTSLCSVLQHVTGEAWGGLRKQDEGELGCLLSDWAKHLRTASFTVQRLVLTNTVTHARLYKKVNFSVCPLWTKVWGVQWRGCECVWKREGGFFLFYISRWWHFNGKVASNFLISEVLTIQCWNCDLWGGRKEQQTVFLYKIWDNFLPNGVTFYCLNKTPTSDLSSPS